MVLSPISVRNGKTQIGFGSSCGYLTFTRDAVGDRVYEGLKNDREAVEKALGVPASWDSDGRKHYISSQERFTGILDEHRKQVQSWLADRVNRYVNVFRPRIVPREPVITSCF